MDERTRAATCEDLRRVAALLEAEQVEYAVTWRDLVPYRTRVEGINVLSLEGLLRMKERGRLKDRADAEAIRRALSSDEDA